MRKIEGNELKEIRKQAMRDERVINCIILEPEWFVDCIWMNIKSGELSFESDDGEVVIGNIEDIDLISVDEYAKKILIYKNTIKDIFMIDEDGSCSYFGTTYIHKSKEMEDKMIKEYAEIEVIPEDKYKIEGEPVIQWHGCYDKSLNYCVDKHYQGIETTLVHGVCKAPIGSYGHAWVEIEDKIVFDGAMQRFYDKEGYYKLHGARKEAEYTPEEAWANLLKFNRHDDWVEDLDEDDFDIKALCNSHLAYE